jgi:hypothetical protein
MARPRLVATAAAAAFALALAACGGSSKPGPPPDTTPPAIANPQNGGLARGDKLVVRFSEPVRAVATTAVSVFDAGGGPLAATHAFLADGSLEVTPAAPLPVPGPVEVRVADVADAAGNLLAQGSAFFRVSGWVDMGYARQGGSGPQVLPMMEVARLAGVTQVVWSNGRAWSDGAGWTRTSSGYVQSLGVDGDLLLHTAWGGGDVAFSSLASGTVNPLTPAPVARPTNSALAGCQAAGGHRAVYAWLEQVAAPSLHFEVKAASWEPGAWTDLGTLAVDAIMDAGNPAAACAPSGTAFVAFSRYPCDAGDCVLVLRRAPGAAGWTEAHRVRFGYTPALALAGERPVVAYPSTSSDIRVEREGDAGWESLGALSTSNANLGLDPAVVVDAGGAPIVAWAEWPEYPTRDAAQARVYVAARRGAAWVILGAGPVNDEVPLAAARAPHLAIGEDGVLEVAYYEWSGGGDPIYGDFHIRVKRFAE